MIITRQTADGSIPLIPRYDTHERVWTAPMPYLFQRQIGDLSFYTRVGWDYLSLNWSLRNTLTTVDAWGTEAAGPVFGGVSDGCIADPLVCDSQSGGSYSVDLERGKS